MKIKMRAVYEVKFIILFPSHCISSNTSVMLRLREIASFFHDIKVLSLDSILDSAELPYQSRGSENRRYW